jgi:sigma-B regulation protein RsbU (phosphoserine phosphatase)
MAGMSPGQVLEAVNHQICNNNQEDMFVTVWLGILDLRTGLLTASNAGHEYPAVQHAGGSFELFKDRHSFVIGGLEDVRYHEYEMHLEPGSRLFLYTDGIPEASDFQHTLFGTDRMLAALNREPSASPRTILENVETRIRQFVAREEQFDDMTMLCLEYRG